MSTNEPQNQYEQRLEAKRERLLERAEQAEERAAQLNEHRRGQGKYLPVGQPILVGHHSEARHRRFLNELERLDRGAIAESEKAQALVERAERVGTGGVSSDDPDAVAKLSAQLQQMKERQEFMKKANRAMRKLNTREEREAVLLEMGEDPKEVGFAARQGKYTFDMTNNNANIRRVTQRIEELKEISERVAEEVEGKGWVYYEDEDDNRICLEFNRKPDEDVRRQLKSLGFKWAPSRGAWVRQLTANGIYAGQQAIRFLQGRDEETE